MTVSYQLPDLLSLIRNAKFELRINNYCRNIAQSSEKWLKDTLNGQEASAWKALRATKVGLLVALCFPTCDAPQLRLITDFMSLLLLSNASTPLGPSDWEDELSFNTLNLTNDGPFRHISSRLYHLVDHAPLGWQTRFASSMYMYQAAQQQVARNRLDDVVPDLESYIELRRDSSGIKMIFDLIEVVGGLDLPSEIIEGQDARRLAHLTADIINWSMDIISYNVDQAKGNKHNLITVLMNEKQLTVQGAISYATTLVKQSLEAFLALERSIPTPVVHSSWSLSSWYSRPTGWDARTRSDVQAYIRGLRDCIVGFSNWAYETEMYFGEKGEEARAFGWVFLTLLPPGKCQ